MAKRSNPPVICSAVLVAVGSNDPNNKRGEKLEEGKWSETHEAPVDTLFIGYAVIFHAGNFYYFGGWFDRSLEKWILRLNAATWKWSKVGYLNSARHGHGVILVENTFMVIGGLRKNTSFIPGQ